jgi:hypothetical protein
MKSTRMALLLAALLIATPIYALAPRRPSSSPPVQSTALDIAVTDAYSTFIGYRWIKPFPYLYRLYRESQYKGRFIEWLANSNYDSPLVIDCEYTITLAASNKKATTVCLDFSSVEGSPVKNVCVPFKWDAFTADYTFKGCPCLSSDHVNSLHVYTEVSKTIGAAQ